MKKLKLDAADLHVLSFRTADAGGEAGTVHGAAATQTCQPYTDAVTCARPCVPSLNPAVTNPCICL